jgi:hypothetical protein
MNGKDKEFGSRKFNPKIYSKNKKKIIQITKIINKNIK